MRKVLWLVPIVLFFVSCSGQTFVYDFSGSAILKDKAVVSYDILVEFKSQQGVDEFNEKLDKIHHAIRIILVQRNSGQMDKTSRLWSVVNKVFKSQLNEPFKKITIKKMDVEPMK